MEQLYDAFKTIKEEFYAESSTFRSLSYSYKENGQNNAYLDRVVNDIAPTLDLDLTGWGCKKINILSDTDLLIISANIPYDAEIYGKLSFRTFEEPFMGEPLRSKRILTVVFPRDISEIFIGDAVCLFMSLYSKIANLIPIHSKFEASMVISIVYLSILEILEEGAGLYQLGTEFLNENLPLRVVLINGFDTVSCFDKESALLVNKNIDKLNIDIEMAMQILEDMKNVGPNRFGLFSTGLYRRMGALLLSSANRVPKEEDNEEVQEEAVLQEEDIQE